MQIFSAKDAKYGFERLIVIAGAGWVPVAKHVQRLVVVLAIEEGERLKALETPVSHQTKEPHTRKRANDC